MNAAILFIIGIPAIEIYLMIKVHSLSLMERIMLGNLGMVNFMVKEHSPFLTGIKV